MKKKFLESPLHHQIFFVTVALTVLSACTFAGILYAQKTLASLNPAPSSNFLSSEPMRMKGETYGIGKHFAITDSEYLNITLDSTEDIDLKLVSRPKVITMMFEAASTTNTQITLSGLLKNTAYYKYEDDYHNLTQFTTDSNGSYAYIQDIFVRHFVFIQTRKSTKFIADNATGGDCTAIGTWNQPTKTCTLTQDLIETVQIDSDGVTLDGNGHKISITPEYSTDGVYLYDKTAVTVKNITVNGAYSGVLFYKGSEDHVSNSMITNCGFGVDMEYGTGNTVNDNIITNSKYSGISIFSSNGNVIKNNKAKGNGTATLVYESSGNLIDNNILEESEILDFSVDSSQFFDGTSCNNMVTRNTGSGGLPIGFFNASTTLTSGIFSELIFCNADDSDVSNVTVRGVGKNNTFLITRTDHSKFSNITVTDTWGLDIMMSNFNEIDGATIDQNHEGIYLSESNHNIIRNSTISNGDLSTAGMRWRLSSDNLIYHNNFINNTVPVYGDAGNSFDLAKPIGGNYWSSYDSSGEGCYDADSDGFCDAPYVFHTGPDNFPWTMKDGWKNAPQIKTVKVAVILAELSDVSHKSTLESVSPCKLPETKDKTYPNGHDKTYYDDMMFCVKDYYRENSYGTVSIEATVFPMWYKLEKPTSYYVGKEDQFVEDAIAISSIDVSGFDIVAGVHSGDSAQLPTINESKLSTRAFDKRDNPVAFPPFALIVAENDPLGAIAHEIGHNLGSLSVNKTLTADLYGDVGNMNKSNYGPNTNHFAEWDLMGWGVFDHLNGMATGTSPSHMSSYTKEFLGWLSPDIHKKSEYGTYTLTPLEFQKFGDKALHYNLTETTEPNFGAYYEIEARKKDTSKPWSAANPSESPVVLYKINTFDRSPYGYTTSTNPLGSNPNSYINRKVNVMSTLSENGIFKDYASQVKFTYINKSAFSPYNVSVAIDRINFTDEPKKIIGAILTPENIFFNLIPYRGFIPPDCQEDQVVTWNNVCIHPDFITRAMNKTIDMESWIRGYLWLVCVFFFIWVLFSRSLFRNSHKRIRILIKVCILMVTLLGVVWLQLAGGREKYRYISEFSDLFPHPNRIIIPYSPSLTPTPLPDLDLHTITPDGRHIGMNYSTGKFENQIAGSEVSGDMQGDEEWIFTSSTERVRYYVSAHDTKAFFDANPDIASQISDKTDKYELYARTIDPSSGIFTSATTSQTINPGSTDFYQITGTTDTPAVRSNNTDSVLYLKGIRDYITAMPTKNKGIKTAYLAQLSVIERSLSKKQTKPAISQIQALEKETNVYIKTKLISKTDGEALLGMLGRLKDMVAK
ncbi:MAG: right-handed parallel beta-helix repeat-containing protein [Candidatus Pacebacteria bacterium]|jgi:parallel beta-helix repeat protein|nr:right-handed parallel beta-helix repeat-containing protein [Candidatus Paceibacterota bacterium]